jgi:hypothetical protein
MKKKEKLNDLQIEDEKSLIYTQFLPLLFKQDTTP